jgi:endonuclease/exonuclease/phosphatase family metal-dependent hydrolase
MYNLSACVENNLVEATSHTYTNRDLVSRYGSDLSFDIITWNIEHFPKDPVHTIPNLSRIIHNIDVDLIAVQEIEDSSSFQTLIDSLDGYTGYFSSLPDYGQRLGIIHKTNIISMSEPYLIFSDDSWAFPRPPMVSFVTVKNENKIVFDLILIIVHLKAFPDEESEMRRRIACNKLKFYVDTYILSGTEKDVIILGDFNDELVDVISESIFGSFISDSSHYHFLTLPLINHPTYIGEFDSSIDHILITDDTQEEYSGGLTRVLDIDQAFPEYLNTISDHRPVLAQFFVF